MKKKLKICRETFRNAQPSLPRRKFQLFWRFWCDTDEQILNGLMSIIRSFSPTLCHFAIKFKWIITSQFMDNLMDVDNEVYSREIKSLRVLLLLTE